MNEEILCSHCRFPIMPGEPKRHYGTHVAHHEARCTYLMQAALERLTGRIAEIVAERDVLKADAERPGLA